MQNHTCPKCKSLSVIHNYGVSVCLLCGFREDNKDEDMVDNSFYQSASVVIKRKSYGRIG